MCWLSITQPFQAGKSGSSIPSAVYNRERQILGDEIIFLWMPSKSIKDGVKPFLPVLLPSFEINTWGHCCFKVLKGLTPTDIPKTPWHLLPGSPPSGNAHPFPTLLQPFHFHWDQSLEKIPLNSSARSENGKIGGKTLNALHQKIKFHSLLPPKDWEAQKSQLLASAWY